jgi:hypothetical protein
MDKDDHNDGGESDPRQHHGERRQLRDRNGDAVERAAPEDRQKDELEPINWSHADGGS